jgi:3',5'-cyclic AMP phosphodiesterase CpdA
VQEPGYTLIQISDPHVEPEGTPSRYRADTGATLGRALAVIEASGLRPDALVLTGDLTERATPAEYRRVRALVAPVAERLGARVAYVAGNHDIPAVLRRELLDEPGDGPLDHVLRVGGLRIVVLDSSVPDRAYGELTAEQLDWLRTQLAEPAPDGTVLALHHPPLPAVTRMTAAMELQRRAELAAVIAGTDVRVVLAGHIHMVSAATLAGVPVWTPGSLASTADALAPADRTRIVRSPGVARIDVFPDTVVATAIPLDAATIADLDPEPTAAKVAELRALLPTT